MIHKGIFDAKLFDTEAKGLGIQRSAGCAGHAIKNKWPRDKSGACYSSLCPFISEGNLRR